MKRYSFNGSRTPMLARRIAVVAFLSCITHSAVVTAALKRSDLLRLTEDASDSRLLLPNEVESGLRQRFQELRDHQSSRQESLEAVEPREYRLDPAPANIDVPLPADALGGEIFEEQLEVMP